MQMSPAQFWTFVVTALVAGLTLGILITVTAVNPPSITRQCQVEYGHTPGQPSHYVMICQ